MTLYNRLLDCRPRGIQVQRRAGAGQQLWRAQPFHRTVERIGQGKRKSVPVLRIRDPVAF